MGLLEFLKPGVVYGEDLLKLFKYAQEKGFAIPSMNCTSSSTINSVLETAREMKAPIAVQFSEGGAAFYAGKGISNAGEAASIMGAIAGAKHVHRSCKGIWGPCGPPYRSLHEEASPLTGRHHRRR
eukprot:EC123413.1.p1 GENE.EC123413.1~~EC123413.1.p1  ORF type:complete len:126 (+),score=24.91 EC123413.1:73-450(+)